MGALIYCRISKDPTGEGIGVTRQQRECLALAERRGLTVDEVLTDNDISAYSGATRPSYSRLLHLVRQGKVTAVLAWHPDRLHRSLRELEEFIAALDTHDVDVHTVTAGDVDLSTPIGRMIARQLGTFARYESEHRSERSVAGKFDAAKRGRWAGPPPYGYDLHRDGGGWPLRDGRLVIITHQAKIIHEAARRVLRGETTYGVAKDLNARGVPGPRGGPWRSISLNALLVSPTAAGLRDYKGTVVGKGLWNPILSEDEHAALRLRLSDNRRTKGVRHAWRYLLTGGLTACGLCGCHLTTQVRSTNHHRVYVCLNSVNTNGCGRISVVAEPLEALVVDRIFDRLGTDAVCRLVANPDAFAREVGRRTGVEARMLEAADAYATGNIGRAEWGVLRQSLARQLRALPAEPAHLGGLTLGDSGALHREWRRLPVDSRRTLLQLIVDKVVVHPARHPGKGFDASRVALRWR